MKQKVKLFFAKIKRKRALFRSYYGWYFPNLLSLISLRDQLTKSRARAFREENKLEFEYYSGKIDLINDLIEKWELRKASKE